MHVAAGNETRGAIVSEAGLERMRQQGLEFSVTQFENAGHMVSHGQPRAFIDDLKAFLARVRTAYLHEPPSTAAEL